MIKIFDVFAENLKTKRIVKLNAYPMLHAPACVFMSKQTKRAESRYFLRDARLDNFTKAYLCAALWSENDEEGEPLENSYSIDAMSDVAIASSIYDCFEFQRNNKKLLERAYRRYKLHNDAPTPEHCAGHDFLLTRNGQGAGFWDRKELGALGKFLTARAKEWREQNFYIGENNAVYVM